MVYQDPSEVTTLSTGTSLRGLATDIQSQEVPEEWRERLEEMGRRFGITAEDVWDTVVRIAGLRRQPHFQNRLSEEAREVRRREYGGERHDAGSRYQRVRIPRGTIPQQGIFHQERKVWDRQAEDWRQYPRMMLKDNVVVVKGFNRDSMTIQDVRDTMGVVGLVSAIYWKCVYRQDAYGGQTFRTNVAFMEYLGARFLNRPMDRFTPALGMHGGSVHGRMIDVYRAFDK